MVQLVGAGGIDPEQLALGDRDQIIALEPLLGGQLVVGEALRVGDRLLQAVDFAADPGSGEIGDLPVIFVAALRNRETGIGLEASLDELLTKPGQSPVSAAAPALVSFPGVFDIRQPGSARAIAAAETARYASFIRLSPPEAGVPRVGGVARQARIDQRLQSAETPVMPIR